MNREAEDAVAEPAVPASLASALEWLGSCLTRQRDLGRSSADRAAAATWLRGNDRFLPVEQAEIYRRQFWLRHTSCLAEDFPGLGGILGQAAWERLVEGYLAAYPPRHWSLSRLGDSLPEYVETCSWLEHPRLCLDMARLERGYSRLFDQADAAPLDPTTLAGLDESSWATAVLRLAPLEVLPVRYPVVELRRRLATGDSGTPIPAEEPATLVLYRDGRASLQVHEVSVLEGDLLGAVMGGRPLLTACEEVAARGEPGELERELGAWLTRWARLGWVSAVDRGG